MKEKRKAIRWEGFAEKGFKPAMKERGVMEW